VQNYLDKIDKMGGAASAIEFMQKEIHKSAYEYQKMIESGEKIVIGVNQYKMEEDHKPDDLLRVNPAVGQMQISKIQKVRAGRNNEEVQNILRELKETAGTEANLVPVLIKAVKEYTTLGEICGVLREVFGEYRQEVTF